MPAPNGITEGLLRAAFIAATAFGLAIFASKHPWLSVTIGGVCGLVYGYRRLSWQTRGILSAAAAILCLYVSDKAGIFVFFFWIFTIAAFLAWDSRNDLR